MEYSARRPASSVHSTATERACARRAPPTSTVYPLSGRAAQSEPAPPLRAAGSSNGRKPCATQPYHPAADAPSSEKPLPATNAAAAAACRSYAIDTFACSSSVAINAA